MISCYMIVQDEEAYIATAIESVHSYPYIAEVIVVDGGSTDNTKVVATKYPKVKLYEIPFNPRAGDRFDIQRNKSIALAKEEWILSLDADEYFEPYVMNALPNLLLSSYDAFRFTHKNFVDHIITNIYSCDYHIWLFKNYCRYVGVFHERVEGYKNCIEVNLAIVHDKTDVQQLLDNQLYWDLGQEPTRGWEKVDGKWTLTGVNC